MVKSNLRCCCKEATCTGARHSDLDEAGVPGFPLISLAWDVGSKGHAKGHRSQTEFCHRGCPGKSGRTAELIGLGQEIPSPDQQTPEALSAYQKAEAEKWWPIIKAANIKGEDPGTDIHKVWIPQTTQ
jgi:hypothetical protein